MRGRRSFRVRWWARWFGIAALLATTRLTVAAGFEAPAFVVPLLPPGICLSAPTTTCLAAALDVAIGSYERREFRDQVAARQLFRAVIRGVNDPAIDVLLVRHDPKQADRLPQLHDEGVRDRGARRAAANAARSSEPLLDGTGERTRVLAIHDPAARASQAGKTFVALIQASRAADAESLFKAVVPTLGRRSEMTTDLALATARAFAAAGNWPAWSAALLAGGFDRKVAGATITSGPEDDPTDMIFDEPLGQGIPAEALLPWINRVRDPGLRSALTSRALVRYFDRGRVAAWTRDFPGFRRHVIDATARGELLRHDPDNAFDDGDETLFGFARDQASRRQDVGLALAVALQQHLKRPPETSAFERDTVRDRIMDAYTTALVSLATDP